MTGATADHDDPTDPADPGALHRRWHGLRSLDGEAGTGLIGTMAAVGAFLLFLLATVQLAVNLYATSTVSAAGYDAARIVASRHVAHHDPRSLGEAQARAEARFHRLLGRAADDAELSWTLTPTSVRLRVVLEPPGILPSALGIDVGFDDLDRTFVVRLEGAG